MKLYSLLSLCLFASMQAQITHFIYVDKNGVEHPIQAAYVDKELRSLAAEQLESIASHMAVSPVEMDNGEYALRAHVRGLGGGGGGAAVGFWAGKAAVYTVTHGVIHGVGWLIPGGGFVASVISSTIAAPVEAASNVVAISCAIALGTATGPI